VGEKGITLSGGQKQRISLARALYSNSKHVLLDDCLSAVDSHTAKWIFEYCIVGTLMEHRTCILVTHNIALCIPKAKYVVVLDNGQVTGKGTPDEVIGYGVLGDELTKSIPASAAASIPPSRVPSNLGSMAEVNENAQVNGNGLLDNTSKDKKKKLNAKDGITSDANIRTEGKAEGGVKWNIILLYLTSMGSWAFWIAAAVIFVAQQIGSVGLTVWIREWSNSYHIQQMTTSGMQRPHSVVNYIRSYANTFSASCLSSGTCAWNFPSFSSASQNVSALTDDSPKVNALYYLLVYALIGMVYLMISLSRELLLFWGSLSASWKIHKRLLEAVTRAKFRFFDSTPLGQMMNRFSKDIEAVDQEVAPIALGALHCLASVIMIVILISVITPGFLIAGVFISAMYFFIGKFYIRSSRDLKRLESVQRSPLYQQFGETLNGITTIRAYGDERRFIRDNLTRVNTHNRPFIYLWATNRWLAFRIDVTGALVAFFAGAFVILKVGRIDSGAAGLSLSYAITFTENVLWLVRLYAINEQNMNS
jgi:ABC-type multidrug transport system fused ATPase/permease subunit